MRACAEEPDSFRQICNLPECSAGLQIRLNDEPIRLSDEPIRLNDVCKSVLLSYFYFENNTEPYDVEN